MCAHVALGDSDAPQRARNLRMVGAQCLQGDAKILREELERFGVLAHPSVSDTDEVEGEGHARVFGAQRDTLNG